MHFIVDRTPKRRYSVWPMRTSLIDLITLAWFDFRAALWEKCSVITRSLQTVRMRPVKNVYFDQFLCAAVNRSTYLVRSILWVSYMPDLDDSWRSVAHQSTVTRVRLMRLRFTPNDKKNSTTLFAFRTRRVFSIDPAIKRRVWYYATCTHTHKQYVRIILTLKWCRRCERDSTVTKSPS